MKAIKINGNIKVYRNLPNSWEGVMGNFSGLSDEEIKAYGFYDVVTPDYNSTIQKLSDIFWDADNEVFTYSVSNIEFSKTLEELKELTIRNLKMNALNSLSVTKIGMLQEKRKKILIYPYL